MNDKDTSIQALKNAVLQFNSARGWNESQKPRNLAISIVLEAAELLELFQWDGTNDVEQVKQSGQYQALKDELADVLIYCLSMANSMDIDLSQAIAEKMEKNGRKYPAP